jgi:magnesium transporter
VTAKKVSKIKSILIGNLEWVHASCTDKTEIEALKRGFHLHTVDLQEALPPLQRAKLVSRDEYLFMILLYPVYDRSTGIIYSSEIDFFISGNRLITVNNDSLKSLTDLFHKLEDSSRTKKKVCEIEGMSHLLYLVLNEMLEDVSPMLLHLSSDIDAIENRMFKEYENGLIKELLRVKTNIVNVRKALQGHKNVIRSLIKYSEGRFPIKRLEVYFERLVEQTKEFWDLLEVEKDTINALHEANMSLIDFRINEIMKTLTIFSVIVFPMTLLAAIFGMNAKYMPFVESEFGFWMIIGLMGLCILSMLFFFKKKKWI